jgi:hypothetical protein
MDYYRVRVYHTIPNSSSLAVPSLIVVAIAVDLVRFLPVYSVHIPMFCSRCVPKNRVRSLRVLQCIRRCAARAR